MEQRIAKYAPKLSSSERKLLESIAAMEYDPALKAADLASKLCISRSALHRLLQKIGLNRFSDLKVLLSARNQDPKQRSEIMPGSVSDLYQSLLDDVIRKMNPDGVCSLIDQAKLVVLYGTGNEQKNIAHMLARLLSLAGVAVMEVFDRGEMDFMQSALDRDDLVILISMSGEGESLIDMARSLAQKVHLLSITRLEANSLSTLCDERLYVSTSSLTSLDYEIMGSFYVLIDLLYLHLIHWRNRHENAQ